MKAHYVSIDKMNESSTHTDTRFEVSSQKQLYVSRNFCSYSHHPSPQCVKHIEYHGFQVGDYLDNFYEYL